MESGWGGDDQGGGARRMSGTERQPRVKAGEWLNWGRLMTVTDCLGGWNAVRRRRGGGAFRTALVLILAALVCGPEGAEGYQITTRQIGQGGACTSAHNTITITYKTDTTLLWSGSNPTTRITVTGIAPSQTSSTPLRLTDHAYVFSEMAILGENTDAAAAEVYIDNAWANGIAVGDNVRVEDEVLLVQGIAGVGCNQSSVVHAGCWNALTVVRGHRGSTAAAHAAGKLVFSVVAGALMDQQTLNDGSKGMLTDKKVVNLDEVGRFEGPLNVFDTRYLYVGEEVMIVDAVYFENATVRGSSTTRKVTLDYEASSVDNFYQDMDVVIWGGVGKGQRQKVFSYSGVSREATLYIPWDVQPVDGESFYSINAVKVQRGQRNTGGTPIVTGSGANLVVTPVGLVHAQYSTVYFTNTTFAWLREPSSVWPGHAWAPSAGVMTIALMADTLPSITKVFSFPIVNSASPQIPAPVFIQGDSARQVGSSRLIFSMHKFPFGHTRARAHTCKSIMCSPCAQGPLCDVQQCLVLISLL